MLVLISTLSVFAQKNTIKAFVYDKTTSDPISNVEVLIQPINKWVVTNSKGVFNLTELKAGKYSMEFNHVSYITQSNDYELKDGPCLVLKINLIPKMYNLDEFVIKGSMIKRVPYIKNTVLREEIEQKAVRDIGDYLRTIPNVSGIRKGGTNIDPVVRGFRFSQLNIQINGGVKIEGGCPNRMDPTLSHVDIDAIEAIEVIKGPYALRYGPSFGGVINLLTTNPKPYDKFEIHLKGIKGYESNWNGTKERLAVMGGNKKVFFVFAGNNENYGNYTAGNGELINSEFRKFSYSGKIGFAIKENHKILFSYDESYGRDVLFAALPMDERTDDTKLMSFDYTARKISKTISSIDAKIFNSDVNHLMDNKNRSFSDTVAATSYIEADQLGYRAEVGLNIFKKGHLYIGTDFLQTKKDGERLKNIIGQDPAMGKVKVKAEDLWNDALIENYGFFTEFKDKFGTFEIVAAVRLDLNKATSDTIKLVGMSMTPPPPVLILNDSTDSEFTNFSFSVGATKKLTDNFSVGLSFGRGVRSPDMIERFIILLPIGYDKYDYLGNPQLEPETNNEVDLTFNYNDDNIGAFELNGFYSKVDNFITGRILPKTVQKPLTAGVIGVKEFYNQDNVNIWGFEFGYKTSLNYKFGANVTAAYTNATVSKITRHIFDANGNATGTEELTNDPLSEMPPMEINANIFYKLFRAKFIPNIHFRYVTSQKNVSQAFYENETPSFTLLDFNMTYKFNSILTLTGGINNILDEAYYEHLNRRVIGSSVNIYEPGRVFFVNLIVNI